MSEYINSEVLAGSWRVFSAVLAGYAIYYIVLALGFPLKFARIFAPHFLSGDFESRNPKHNKRNWSKFAAYIGSMFLVWSASYIVLDWMPHSWMTENEDGGRSIIREDLRFFVAIFAGPVMLEKLEDSVKKQWILALMQHINGCMNLNWWVVEDDEKMQAALQKMRVRGLSARTDFYGD